MRTVLGTETGQAVMAHGLSAADWIGAAVILAAGVALGALLRTFLGRALRRGDSERAAADHLTRTLAFLVAAGALFWSLSVLGVRLGPLFGALGIGGLAIAFAAQSILANFLASVILQLRRPFRRGDQIETADCEGVVEDVDFRTVRLRTFDGERVLVPCADVLGNPIVNHTTTGRRRTTLEVDLGYDTDLAEARRLLLGVVGEAEGVLDRPPPEVWVKKFGESGVSVAIRFWHAPEAAAMWRVRSEVAVVAKAALDHAGIQIPFPHRTVSFVPDPALETSVSRNGDHDDPIRNGGSSSGVRSAPSDSGSL